MKAGQLDRRVDLQQQTTTRDEYGGEVTAWLTIVTVWANKRESTGVEAFQADQLARATLSAVWRIRYRSGVQAKMRLIDEVDQAWDVEGVSEIGRHEGLELKCTRVQA